MTVDERIQRLEELKVQFQKLLDYHEASFRDIDTKAKYWLTVSLPSFLALVGYLTKQANTLPATFLVGGSALAACLLISTWFCSAVLLSVRVESGVLAPQSRRIEDAHYFLESTENWLELCQDQANEMLSAVAANEEQNKRKSRWLRLGEVSLFFAAPAAACVGGCTTFLYAAACPNWLAAIGCSAGSSAIACGIAGAAIGAGTAGAVVAFSHAATSKT